MTKKTAPPGWFRDVGGATLVEFALTSSIFLATVFGTLVFGLAVWQNNFVAALAQEGARWAAVRGSSTASPATSTSVNAFVQGRALGVAGLTVTTTWPDGGSPANAAGKRVQVRIQKTFTPLTALLPNAPWTLQSTAQMTITR